MRRMNVRLSPASLDGSLGPLRAVHCEEAVRDLIFRTPTNFTLATPVLDYPPPAGAASYSSDPVR
jgi:hypothetical protein